MRVAAGQKIEHWVQQPEPEPHQVANRWQRAGLYGWDIPNTIPGNMLAPQLDISWTPSTN